MKCGFVLLVAAASVIVVACSAAHESRPLAAQAQATSADLFAALASISSAGAPVSRTELMREAGAMTLPALFGAMRDAVPDTPNLPGGIYASIDGLPLRSPRKLLLSREQTFMDLGKAYPTVASYWTAMGYDALQPMTEAGLHAAVSRVLGPLGVTLALADDGSGASVDEDNNPSSPATAASDSEAQLKEWRCSEARAEKSQILRNGVEATVTAGACVASLKYLPKFKIFGVPAVALACGTAGWYAAVGMMAAKPATRPHDHTQTVLGSPRISDVLAAMQKYCD